jgi:hypothetical protein
MLDDAVKVTQAVLAVVQTLALVVGGGWVYFKFIRGRTFAPRAELDIDAELMVIGDRQVIKAKVALKNAGLSKLPLREHAKVVRLYGIPISARSPQANFAWQKLIIAEVFEDQGWVEAQETIHDAILLPVDQDAGPWLAFRAQASVWAERRAGISSGTRWLTNTILPAAVSRPPKEG